MKDKTNADNTSSLYEPFLKRKGRVELQKLTVMYPDGSSIELKSVKGGIVNVPVQKEQHQAWGLVKITKTTDISSKYQGWI